MSPTGGGSEDIDPVPGRGLRLHRWALSGRAGRAMAGTTTTWSRVIRAKYAETRSVKDRLGLFYLGALLGGRSESVGGHRPGRPEATRACFFNSAPSPPR